MGKPNKAVGESVNTESDPCGRCCGVKVDIWAVTVEESVYNAWITPRKVGFYAQFLTYKLWRKIYTGISLYETSPAHRSEQGSNAVR